MDADEMKAEIAFEEYFHVVGGDEWHGNGGPGKAVQRLIFMSGFRAAVRQYRKEQDAVRHRQVD